MEDPFKDFSVGDPFQTWWPFIIAAVVGIITTIRSYFGGQQCPSKATITGKTVVITGGSSGVGLSTVIELARRGGHVIIGSPDKIKAEEEIKRLKKAKRLAQNAVVSCRTLDLASFQSVKDFVQELGDIIVDVLINNAGIVFHPYTRTEDGLEKHLQVNYLGHFMLTHMLLSNMERSDDARIINVSAQAHTNGDLDLVDMNRETDNCYNKCFGQSKLALVMMAKYMSTLLKDSKIKINAMEPGIVRGTRHLRYSPFDKSVIMRVTMFPWMWLFAKSPEQAAQTIVYMSVAHELQQTTGAYFNDCKITKPSVLVDDNELLKCLYEESCRLTNIESLEKKK